MVGKKSIAALVAEFLGTGVLTLLILSVQRSQLGLQYFVALAAGVAIMLMTFVVGRASGGYFNPAITLALWTARKISTITGFLYIVFQFLGALVALAVYSYFSNTHLTSVGGHYTGRILFAEAIGTGIFSFSYAATLNKNYTHAARSAFAGLSYAMGILVASSAALGLLNPAVALGIKAWVWGTYVLGPVIGAIVGINLYNLLFANSSESVEAIVVEAGVVSVSSASVTAKAPAKSKKKVSKKK